MIDKVFRSLAALAAGILVLASLDSPPQAQGSISVTFGKFGSSPWPAGPDYATEVLGDPWDFCNAEDVAPDPSELAGWANFSTNGSGSPCMAGGTTTTLNGGIDTQMSLLFRGRYGFNNTGRNGRRYPIDPSRYQKISYRMRDTAGGDSARIHWFLFPWEDPSLPPSDPNGGGVRFAEPSLQGWGIYSYDLTKNLAAGRAWTSNGVVRGLRLAPTTGKVGHDVFYDWVRLTAPDDAPQAAMQTISWSGGTGSATVQVLDSQGTTFTVGTNISGSSLSWNYGVLPPGTYTLRVTRGGTIGERTFAINAPPLVHLAHPNETGGEDYAATVLGNPWDMDSALDIQITGVEHFTPVPPNFTGGILTATNVGDDPQIALLTNGNNATPIDTSRYRYFTIRMTQEDPNNTREFGILRMFWSPADYLNGPTATGTRDVATWPGWHTYTVDLAPLTTAPDGGLEPAGAQQVWTSANMRHFRVDPSEFPDPRPFHIDYVKLAAMAETVGGGFNLTWTNVSKPGTTVALYYDSDRNPASGRTLIAAGATAGTGQYYWNAAGVAPGDYWIYIEANDGIQTLGRYSTGQLRVLGASAASRPAMAVDAPLAGSAIAQPFAVAGWAVDLGASSGTGVDAVDVWAYPSAGGSPTFAGSAALGGTRTDIGSAFGSQFTNAGFTLNVTGLAPGGYNLVASARSTVTGAFNQSRTVPVTVATSGSNPAMALDSPASGATVGSTFSVTGWAVDLGATTGTGVSSVHVWAFPSAGPAVFLGAAAYGGSRPDIGALFGSRFTNSGFNLSVSGLPPGAYQVAAYAQSTVTGTFSFGETASFTVGGSVSMPRMALDAPVNGATLRDSFTVAGWALDVGASSGTGVSDVHLWAFPLGGGSPQFLGAGAYGIARPDVSNLFGSTQFTNCGYAVDVAGGALPSGTYDLVVYAHSTVANAFNQWRAVRVTVR